MKEKPRPDFDDELPRYCMNRQHAIQALCVKPNYFDTHIRPRLRTTKQGTSLLFLCEEVKAIAYEMFNAPGTEIARAWVFRTNVTAGFGIVTEDFGPS